MAGDEDQTQHIVVDDIRIPQQVSALPLLQVVREQGETLVEALLPSPPVDGPALGHRREPGTGVARNPIRRPLLQRIDERFLGQLLRETEVADHPGESTDDAGGLDAPDGGDGALGRPGVGCRTRRLTVSGSVHRRYRLTAGRAEPAPRASRLPSRSTRCRRGSPRLRSPCAPRGTTRVREARGWPTPQPLRGKRPRGSRNR